MTACSRIEPVGFAAAGGAPEDEGRMEPRRSSTTVLKRRVALVALPVVARRERVWREWRGAMGEAIFVVVL